MNNFKTRQFFRIKLVPKCRAESNLLFVCISSVRKIDEKRVNSRVMSISTEEEDEESAVKRIIEQTANEMELDDPDREVRHFYLKRILS